MTLSDHQQARLRAAVSEIRAAELALERALTGRDPEVELAAAAALCGRAATVAGRYQRDLERKRTYQFPREAR